MPGRGGTKLPKINWPAESGRVFGPRGFLLTKTPPLSLGGGVAPCVKKGKYA